MSSLEVQPVTPVIGAEIGGIDLAQPLDDETAAALNQALLDHQVLAFRDQHVPLDRLIDFARHFGHVSLPPVGQPHPQHPEAMIFDLSAPRGAGADTWHVDGVYMKAPPKATILQAITLPKLGGDTFFANMYAAYEALSPAFREMLAGLRAVHDVTEPMRRAINKEIYEPEEFETMRKENPPVDHPLVRTHPETGRKSLFLSENTTTKILGLTDRENELLLPFLLNHVKSSEFQCRVRWDPHTIAFWDQRCTLHYAVPDYCERRVMYRLSLDGDVPH
ncbi:MAG: taurine dioxygenase [Deltaproteobacteria bacterium]|nr:taurine dioxygenase [Deltaproteobacteria bacterium]